jgi:hypothetical protein
MVEQRDILAHELDLLLLEGVDILQQSENVLKVAFKIEILVIDESSPEKDRVGVQVE